MKNGAQKVRLKEVCDRITVGHVGSMRDEYVSSGIPFLRSQNIKPFRLNKIDIKFISPEFHERLKKSSLKPGDVAVVRTGHPGTACVIPANLPVSNCSDLVIITPSATQLDSRYLAAVFNSSWGIATVGGNLVGVAQQHFNVSAAKEMEINLPDLPTQCKIAGVLSAYDDLIENNLRRIRILEQMAQSLYHEWFVHFRFPGHQSTKMTDSPVGRIPHDWEVVSIEDVCERVTDGSHSSPKSVEQGMPMVSSKDMHSFGLNLETARHISRDDYDKLVRNGCQPKANDILIIKDGANYLKHIIVVEKDLDIVLLSSVAILTPSARISPHFFAALLNLSENKERLKNYVTGAAIPRIILKDFKRFQFILPSREVRDSWEHFGEASTRLCWDLIEKNRNLRRTRDLLLPKLISEPPSAR